MTGGVPDVMFLQEKTNKQGPTFRRARDDRQEAAHAGLPIRQVGRQSATPFA